MKSMIKPMPLEMEMFTSSWNDIKTIGSGIFESARNEDWNSTLELAKRRHERLLEHFNEFPINPETSWRYKTIIEEMISAENQLQQIISKARIKLSVESKRIHNQKTGISAYQLSGM